MPIPPARTIAKQLSDLRAQYLIKVDQVLSDLNLQVWSMEAHLGRGQLQAMQGQLHKLAGSGGSFGFPELSEKARLLELTAQQWLDAKHDLDPEQWQQWASNVFSLRLLVHWNKEELPLSLPRELLLKPNPLGTNITFIHANQAQALALTQGLHALGYLVSPFADLGSAQATLLKSPADILLVAMNEQASANEQLKEALDQLFTQPGKRLHTIYLVPNNESSFQLAAAHAQMDVCLSLPIEVSILAGHIEVILREGEPPMRILIVDDDVELAEHYRLVLQSAGMLAQTVSDPGLALATLGQFNPDLLLLDLEMPNISGAVLARMIRYESRWKSLTISYLSAQTDLVLQLRAMSNVVDEFLIKPISDMQLVACAQSRAIRSRQLAAIMSQDSMTGLLTHNGIKNRLVQEVDRAKRQNKPMSCAMIDIDSFKRINDKWGHPMGDQVINSLANLMQQRLRLHDSLGRYGGDEFLAVLPECSVPDAQCLIDELREHFSKIVFNAGSKHFQVTLSAGIASSDSFANADAMIAATDQALYQAKHNGRNQVYSHEAILPPPLTLPSSTGIPSLENSIG